MNALPIEDQNYLPALNHSAWEPEDVCSTPELDNRGPGNLSIPIQFTENPHEYRHNIHSCAANDRFQSGSLTVQTDEVHFYRRLPSTSQKTADGVWGDSDILAPSRHPQSRGDEPAQLTKSNMSAKFECVACNAQFAYESSAKRHQRNQVKRFQCKVCLQKFARSDYRNLHQRRCIDFGAIRP
ncbi:hypothetical protein K439DRAFT_810415 [Ramaria rubella]|nr:hypothetical protein K439DRAFT_810415 [Ramaria rubella]